MKSFLIAATVLSSAPAHAWTTGSQLDYTGCHERITTTAFRATRVMFPTVAPPIPPTRDEAALIDAVQFVPPADFKGDLAAMALLLGVRDNDLKGNNPLDSLQLVQVHGNPATQEEHCIRNANDDGTPGDSAALDRCRQFIHTRIAEALEGLAADGSVDANNRMELAVWVSFAGRVHPELPVTYVKLGQAVHALEDGFTHTYRTADGLTVTTVMNWIDYVSNAGATPERDGPPHLANMDHCESTDPLVQRNYALAITAATALLEIALDPTKTSDDKLAAVDALTTQYLSYQPGCTIDNNYCNAPEPAVPAPPGTVSCSTGGGSGLLAIPLVLAFMLRRRRRSVGGPSVVRSGTSSGRGRADDRFGLGLATIALLACAAVASAQPAPDEPAPPPPAPPAPPAPSEPALPAPAEKPAEAAAVQGGHEPGRDVTTPTVAEVEKVREDKELGSPFGFAFTIGGSFVHGGAATAVAGRYRIDERWLVGIDAEWNPWITTAPLMARAGAASLYATVIHRYPMKLDRVNLRTTFSLGASTLLFDVYGAPKYDIGPFVGFSPLGIDYDLGNSVRIIFDPLGVEVPVPHIGLIPLYYEQFRTMIGIQIGA